MRLKLLTLLFLSGFFTTFAQNRLAVEGRTWWYHGVDDYSQIEDELGISIGKPVEIDGVQWNEIVAIKRALYNSVTHEELRWSTDTCRVAFIREDEGKIFTLFDTEAATQDIFWNTGEMAHHGITGGRSPKAGMNIYNFNAASDSTFVYGIPVINVGITVDSVDTLHNSGNDFTRFNGTISNVNGAFPELSDQPYTYLDKVGFIPAQDGRPTSELFYAPLGEPCQGSTAVPMLRYVTEGPDHEILYTGLGGTRFWEVQSGVANVAIDNTDLPVEWFNLQGQPVQTPRQPGIYIRRQGTHSHKTVVR